MIIHFQIFLLNTYFIQFANKSIHKHIFTSLWSLIHQHGSAFCRFNTCVNTFFGVAKIFRHSSCKDPAIFDRYKFFYMQPSPIVVNFPSSKKFYESMRLGGSAGVPTTHQNFIYCTISLATLHEFMRMKLLIVDSIF